MKKALPEWHNNLEKPCELLFKKHIAVLFCIVLLIGLRAVPVSAADAGESESETMVQRVQAAKQDILSRKAGQYGMVPIYGQDLEDGRYEIKVDSSSPYFRISTAELIVKDHAMSAKITISSLSYLYVYPGTLQEARRSDESSYIGYEESDGQSIFTIPVKALDAEIDCAAYSKKRKKWYDRTLVFYASSLPKDAVHVELPDYDLIEAAIRAYDTESEESASAAIPPTPPEPVPLSRDDGEYSIEVNMTGGSGRASISSPTLLIVRDGKAYARLLWSSTYYDYMIVGEETYYNLSDDGGNSTFEIPVTVMDGPMQVIADTTAMGEPVEIRYTLTFYEESIGDKGQIPQEAAKKVLYIAAAIILLGGILNWLIKQGQK